MPFGLDSMLQREAVRARALGVEQILHTPQAFINDLTDMIDQLDAEINGPQENES